MSPSLGRLTRREAVQLGLSGIGLTLADLARLRALPAENAATHERRRNSCVFLFLFGGPSQIDLWDMKPDAPDEVRGEFRPIATARARRPRLRAPAAAGRRDGQGLPAPVDDAPDERPRPGVQRGVQRPAVLRPADHRPGQPRGLAVAQLAGRAVRPAAAAGCRRRSSCRGTCSSPASRSGSPARPAGGWASGTTPSCVDGDLGRADFDIEGLRPARRRARRPARDAARTLLDRLDDAARRPAAPESFDGDRRAVYDLLGSRAGEAFDLRREPRARPRALRPTAVGQSLLLARRLVEAGVSLVTVNWQDETKIDGVEHLLGHAPEQLRQAEDAAVPDLRPGVPGVPRGPGRARPAGDDAGGRGRASSAGRRSSASSPRAATRGRPAATTGRTPSRRSWPAAACAAGRSTARRRATAATSRDKPVTPADLTATILHHLGIDQRGVRGRVPAPAEPAERRQGGARAGVTWIQAWASSPLR